MKVQVIKGYMKKEHPKLYPGRCQNKRAIRPQHRLLKLMLG